MSPDFGWDLPPGVTTSMCEAGLMDENALCGCGHPAHEHAVDSPYPSESKECECKELTDDYEPDMDDYDD